MKTRNFINTMLVAASICCSTSVWMYNSDEDSNSNNTIADLRAKKQDLSNGYGKAYISPAEKPENVKITGTIVTSKGIISFDGVNSDGVFPPME